MLRQHRPPTEQHPPLAHPDKGKGQGKSLCYAIAALLTSSKPADHLFDKDEGPGSNQGHGNDNSSSDDNSNNNDAISRVVQSTATAGQASDELISVSSNHC